MIFLSISGAYREIPENFKFPGKLPGLILFPCLIQPSAVFGTNQKVTHKLVDNSVEKIYFQKIFTENISFGVIIFNAGVDK